MTASVCGLDCAACGLKDSCEGCIPSNGRPFHSGQCPLFICCESKGHERCAQCSDGPCGLKDRLIAEFNALGIADMERVIGLNTLPGSYINLEYTMPSGQVVKLLEDEKIYLGNQICKTGSQRCYGLVADERFLLVCEYGEEGSDAEIVVYKRRENV